MEKGKTEKSLTGRLIFAPSAGKLFSGERIHLLEKIDELGSINKAAKAVGIRYTTAWSTIKSINDMAEQPLVRRLTGGKGGGGTSLTAEGKKIVTQFRIVQEERRRFIERLECRLNEA